MKVKEIQFEAGVTIEVKGTYFKETYREVVEIEEGDDVEQVRLDTIDRVHKIVDDQIEEIRRANG